MHQALAFLFHRWRSKSRHGLHSPFIYGLVDECIYAKSPQVDPSVQQYFSALKRDRRALTGMDHGLGQETTRTVSDYAKTSAMPDFQADFLHRLSHYLQPQMGLELGSNLGKSLCYSAAAHPAGRFVGVEGNAAVANFARESLNELGIDRVDVRTAHFDDVLKDASTRFDWMFLDGDHSYAPTLHYFAQMKERLQDQGVIILHDIYHSDEMTQAWNDIKKDRDVQVTLDLFFFGFVWLDLPQAKEDFSIRFPRSLFRLL